MEKIKKQLDKALAALQLARNEQDRLIIMKRPVVIDDSAKLIIDALKNELSKMESKSV